LGYCRACFRKEGYQTRLFLREVGERGLLGDACPFQKRLGSRVTKEPASSDVCFGGGTCGNSEAIRVIAIREE
jgi:hypothetical protein